MIEFQFTTVDTILDDFNRKVVKLQELSQKLTEKAISKEAEIAVLATKAKEHRSEAKRAYSVAEKIKVLVS